MLALTSNGVASLQKQQAARFEKEIAQLLQQNLPHHYNQLSESEAEHFVAQTLKKAQAKNLTDKQSIGKYITLTLVHGNNLEDNPSLPQGQLLKQPVLTDSTINQVYHSATEQLSTIQSAVTPPYQHINDSNALQTMEKDIALMGDGSIDQVIMYCPLEPQNDDETTVSHFIELEYRYQDDEPVQHAPYWLTTSSGAKFEGRLNNEGKIRLENMPKGSFTVSFGEDSRDYEPLNNTTVNPLLGKISPQQAVAMVDSGDRALLDQAITTAANAGAGVGDWIWGTLQGDFNEDPTTAQIVVGTVISMLPVVDQIMDARDLVANIMILTDDDDANDTNGWIALSLTAIGLVPILGSALKGVLKILIKKVGATLDAAFAVLRKLGKGDPEQFLRRIDWADLTNTATKAAKEQLNTIKAVLDAISNSQVVNWTLNSKMVDSIKQMTDKLAAFEKRMDQGISDGIKALQTRVNDALSSKARKNTNQGITDQSAKTRTIEKDRPTKGYIIKPDVNLKNHYKEVEVYEQKYRTKLRESIENNDSARRQGSFKGKITEAKGERGAAMFMEKNFATPPPPAEMVLGFGPGRGFDQVWLKRDSQNNISEYFIVEAKGPGAKLSKGADKGDQMTNKWINNSLKEMDKSKIAGRAELSEELFDAIERGDPKVNKLVIEAINDNGQITGGILKPLPVE